MDDIKIEKEEGVDEEDLPAQAGSKVKKIKEQLKKCKKEKEEYLDGWQRAKADFINARKEEEKRQEKIVKLSNQFLLMDILPVLDSFELAFKGSEKDKGFYLIKSQLENVLKKYGLEVMKTKDQKFNPEFHESVAEIESEKESGIVVEEIQKGYKLHGKILRAARVKIAK